jgi:hypothetical protein
MIHDKDCICTKCEDRQDSAEKRRFYNQKKLELYPRLVETLNRTRQDVWGGDAGYYSVHHETITLLRESLKEAAKIEAESK